jgi:hypothetical protein
MRQLTLTLLSLIAVAATLFAAGPSRALACSCAGIQPTEQFAREMLAYHDLAVIGEVTSFEQIGQDRYRAEIAVELSYGTIGPRAVTIVTDGGGVGCGYGASLRERGRHFMMLTTDDDGTYSATFCSSFPMTSADAPASEYERGYGQFIEILAGIVPRYQPTAVASTLHDGNASPWLVIAYAGGSIGVLAALSGLRQWIRRRPHSPSA